MASVRRAVILAAGLGTRMLPATKSVAKEMLPIVDRPIIQYAVEEAAAALGGSCRRMPSGAGHDAQMMSRVCPTGMVFVPSVGGVSHNPTEFTRDEDVVAGGNALFAVAFKLLKS